jgi:redox-sensitive bicupin YhaK (pirin superfamily)
MITVRKANDRGHSAISWLDSWHTFSFSDYYDPDHMGFRALRVINDDRVAGGMGFGTHPHRDMEIVTYVLDGALEHKDSLGNGDVMRPGDVQYMSAGTGIFHSEFNPDAAKPVHLLQIWIQPDKVGGKPTYGQKHFPLASRKDRLTKVVDNVGADGALKIGADAAVYASVLSAGKQVEHTLAPGRHAWLHVAKGSVTANGQKLSDGDAIAVSDEAQVSVTADQDSELLLFDLK